MTRRALLWFIPLIITVHNLEELFTMPRALDEMAGKVPAWLARVIPIHPFPPTYQQYAITILIVTVLPYLLALLGGARRARGLRTFLLAELLMVMLVNVLSHVVMMNVLNGYAPGLATALLVNLPFALYFFGSGLRQGWLKGSDLGAMALIALLLHTAGLFGILALVSRL
jgi:hypothetical protein